MARRNSSSASWVRPGRELTQPRVVRPGLHGGLHPRNRLADIAFAQLQVEQGTQDLVAMGLLLLRRQQMLARTLELALQP